MFVNLLTWFNIQIWEIQHAHIQISKHLKGRLLDIGCGTKQEVFKDKVTQYIGLDNPTILKKHGSFHNNEADVFGDAMNLPFKKNSFDSVVALSLLEHVAEPEKVLSEAYRVLKKGGFFAVTVPFMNRVHMAPHDYFRFTEYGITYLLKKVGFRVTKVIKYGGMWKMFGVRLSGYLYSDIMGLGYSDQDRTGKKRIYLIPLLAPIIFMIVIFSRIMDKLDTTTKDYVMLYVYCKK